VVGVIGPVPGVVCGAAGVPTMTVTRATGYGGGAIADMRSMIDRCSIEAA